jgi:hypothetical protein
MGGANSIWRGDNNEPSGHKLTETNAGSDKIEFDINNAVPDTTGHIHNNQFSMNTGIAENEKAFADTNELQFTKFEGITLKITGSIQNPPGSLVAKKMKVWTLEDQDNDIFTKGRFGLRMDDFPIFNVSPTSLDSGHPRGYAIQSIDFVRSDLAGKIDFVMVLRLSGDLKNGTGTNYDWS